MNTLKSFLSYIFKSTPGDMNHYWPLIAIIIVILAGAIAMHFIYKEKKKTDPAFRKLFRKTTPRLVIFSIFFTFYGLVRYEAIPYFSMRLWLYAGILVLGLFIYKTVNTYRIDYPREKHNVTQIKSTQSKKQEKQYLPNKKKR